MQRIDIGSLAEAYRLLLLDVQNPEPGVPPDGIGVFLEPLSGYIVSMSGFYEYALKKIEEALSYIDSSKRDYYMNAFIDMEVWPSMSYDNVLDAIDDFQDHIAYDSYIPDEYKLTKREYDRVNFVLDGV